MILVILYFPIGFVIGVCDHINGDRPYAPLAIWTFGWPFVLATLLFDSIEDAIYKEKIRPRIEKAVSENQKLLEEIRGIKELRDNPHDVHRN